MPFFMIMSLLHLLRNKHGFFAFGIRDFCIFLPEKGIPSILDFAFSRSEKAFYVSEQRGSVAGRGRGGSEGIVIAFDVESLVKWDRSGNWAKGLTARNGFTFAPSPFYVHGSSGGKERI